MKKRSISVLLASVVACSMMFTSCIGSFGLTNKLLSWNKGVNTKFVNELVFVAFHIVPVYPISVLADILVINTIEFWSGSNPVADAGTVKNVETEQGLYAIETTENGYQIQKEGDDVVVDLVFDATDNSWSVEAEGEIHKLLRFENNDEVVMYLPDGEEMNVQLNEAGILAFQQVADNFGFYASK